jgi:hypothetical protein
MFPGSLPTKKAAADESAPSYISSCDRIARGQGHKKDVHFFCLGQYPVTQQTGASLYKKQFPLIVIMHICGCNAGKHRILSLRFKKSGDMLLFF